MTTETTPVGAGESSPALDGSEWRRIAIFEDGSGAAGEYYDAAQKTIQEREDVLNLNRAFIEKHKRTLAGMYWSVGYLDPEIKVGHGRYRGQKAGPAEIAALWPAAEWRRVRQKYSDGLTYDWCGVVDGVTIHIERAEREEPRPKLAEGVIRIPNMTEQARAGSASPGSAGCASESKGE